MTENIFHWRGGFRDFGWHEHLPCFIERVKNSGFTEDRMFNGGHEACAQELRRATMLEF